MVVCRNKFIRFDPISWQGGNIGSSIQTPSKFNTEAVYTHGRTNVSAKGEQWLM